MSPNIISGQMVNISGQYCNISKLPPICAELATKAETIDFQQKIIIFAGILVLIIMIPMTYYLYKYVKINLALMKEKHQEKK